MIVVQLARVDNYFKAATWRVCSFTDEGNLVLKPEFQKVSEFLVPMGRGSISGTARSGRCGSEAATGIVTPMSSSVFQHHHENPA